jgi:hypothetical protein
MGCDKLSTGDAGSADKVLCEALLACIRRTGCWAMDPLLCLCGTALDTACLAPMAANGACRDEAFAATKATNDSDAVQRFYDVAYPSGYATQVIACDFGFCSSRSDPPRNACDATPQPGM